MLPAGCAFHKVVRCGGQVDAKKYDIGTKSVEISEVLKELFDKREVFQLAANEVAPTSAASLNPALLTRV